MIEKKITCIVCPVGCEITVCGERGEITSVLGYACKRGEEYARNEYSCPARILTSTVKAEKARVPLVPVRSDKPVPQELLMQCMDEIRKVKLSAPIHCCDVIISDIMGTGINIVATGDVL